METNNQTQKMLPPEFVRIDPSPFGYAITFCEENTVREMIQVPSLLINTKIIVQMLIEEPDTITAAMAEYRDSLKEQKREQQKIKEKN